MVKKNQMGTVLKFVISLAFIAYVGFEVYKSTSDNQVKEKSQKFFLSRLDHIDAIHLIAGTTQIKLQQQDSSWRMVEPLKAAANDDILQGWIETMKESSTETKPSEDEENNIEKYGLHDPLAKIVFTDSKNGSFELSISATKTFDGKFYVGFSDKIKKNIILVSDLPWFDFILKKPIDFLNPKNVFKYTGETLKELDFKVLNSPSMAGQKLKQGAFVKTNHLWAFKGESSIDGASALDLLSRLKDTHVYGFEPDTLMLKKQKDVKPIFEIKFLLNDNSVDQLVIYNYFRPCVVEDAQKNCQFMVLQSNPYPIWANPDDVSKIVDLSFLKK